MYEIELSDANRRALADSVNALAVVLSVEDDADARTADAAVKMGKTFVKVVHDQRMSLSRQVDAVKKQLIARENEICADLNAELARVQKLCGDYVAAKAEAQKLAAERAEAMGEVVKAAKPVDGVSAREYWGFKITDPFAVPRQYCKPDETAIRSYLDAAKRNGAEIDNLKIEGVEFFKEFRV